MAQATYIIDSLHSRLTVRTSLDGGRNSDMVIDFDFEKAFLHDEEVYLFGFGHDFGGTAQSTGFVLSGGFIGIIGLWFLVVGWIHFVRGVLVLGRRVAIIIIFIPDRRTYYKWYFKFLPQYRSFFRDGCFGNCHLLETFFNLFYTIGECFPCGVCWREEDLVGRGLLLIGSSHLVFVPSSLKVMA